MHKLFIGFLIFFMVFFVGCALLDKTAPAKYDDQGNIIPGSREATETTKAVAGLIPYGDVALGVVLLLAAGYEKYQAYKLEKGLKATLLAGKKVANDPQMKELWDKVKEAYYRPEHASAGVTALIKSLMAKLPTV